MAQWLACRVHNPKVRGPKPRSAMRVELRSKSSMWLAALVYAKCTRRARGTEIYGLSFLGAPSEPAAAPCDAAAVPWLQEAAAAPSAAGRVAQGVRRWAGPARGEGATILARNSARREAAR